MKDERGRSHGSYGVEGNSSLREKIAKVEQKTAAVAQQLEYQQMLIIQLQQQIVALEGRMPTGNLAEQPQQEQRQRHSVQRRQQQKCHSEGHQRVEQQRRHSERHQQKEQQQQKHQKQDNVMCGHLCFHKRGLSP